MSRVAWSICWPHGALCRKRLNQPRTGLGQIRVGQRDKVLDGIQREEARRCGLFSKLIWTFWCCCFRLPAAAVQSQLRTMCDGQSHSPGVVASTLKLFARGRTSLSVANRMMRGVQPAIEFTLWVGRVANYASAYRPIRYRHSKLRK